ncbi:hypothetical protein L2E82_11527 [Cichorium intybus]|uniref:Uncharacterized protein n=1 Tax=Cichorium intybus TaxID=13427 RepID=A0ACB9GEL7_CICIN|nr:hypothetical protein L2E82_11527 [Cichorium intybus]
MDFGDAPPSFSSGMINHFDQEQFQDDPQAFGTPNDQPSFTQPPSQSSIGHGQGNSLNQFPDEIVNRGLGQPDETDGREEAPSFTALGRGQGISNNQDWNSNREYRDGVQPLSRSALVRDGHSNPSGGGSFDAGDASPGISDVDRRGTSETGPRGSSTDTQSSADEQEMAGMSLVGRNFQKYYPNAYYKEKDEN